MQAGKHKAAAFLILAMLVALCFLAGCKDAEDYVEARAYKVTSRSELIGGPKSLGNTGDYIIENDRIRVLINGHATDMSGGGVNRWGGAILDADIQRRENAFYPSVSGKDALLEIVPIMDVKTFGFENIIAGGPVVRIPQDAITVVSDGSDGGPAQIKAEGVLHELITLLKIIPVPLNFLPVKAETVYTLAPGKNYLEIRSTFTLMEKDGSEPAETFEIPLRPVTAEDNALAAMFTGDFFGDAVFWGDSLDIIGPGVYGFSPSWYAEELFNRGISMFIDTPTVDWSAGVNDEVGYGLVSPNGPLSFPVTESFLTIAAQQVTEDGPVFPDPGSTYTYTRYLVVAEGDVSGVLDQVVDIKNWPYGNLKGNVIDEADGRAVSGASVLAFPHPRFVESGEYAPVKSNYEEMNEYLAAFDEGEVDYHRLMPYSRFKTDGLRYDAAADGSFEGKLPVDEQTMDGRYILMASGPANTHSDLLPIRIKDGEQKEVSLILPTTGVLTVRVRSYGQNGPGEPCKLSIIGVDEQGVGDPFLGESYVPGKMAEVLFSKNGKFEAKLQPGTYRVVATRGPEYSTDESRVTIKAMENREVDLYIDRVVDTSGWISADLHMHSQVSPDSGVELVDRVLCGMAEDVDLIASTDHDAITNYRPALEQLGGLDNLTALRGDELSHFNYAHFNGYPLKYDQTKTSGGAPQWRNPSPTTTLPDGSPMPVYTPQDCFDALRNLTDHDVLKQDAMVVANHNQESITGYLRAFGFEQYYGTFGAPDLMTVGDPVVHNGSLFSTDGSVNFSWDFDGIELLNSKRLQDFRTITEEEITHGEFGEPKPEEVPLLPTLIRTAEEQERISSGDLLLDHTNRGMIDDYMTILAMGKRVAGLGVSDTHSTYKNPVGKCRTYIMSSTDDPKFMDMDEVITNLKAGRAIATTGPFMEVWVDGSPIGSDVYDPDGTIDVRIKAQAPPWMSLNRIEIYGNGILIGEIGADVSTDIVLDCDTKGMSLRDGQVVRFDDSVTCRVDRDTFILAMGIGYESLAPLTPPEDGPSIEIDDTLLLGVNGLLEEWLGISNLVPVDSPIERNHDNYPFVVTNAIFVDIDGGDFDGDGYDYDGPGYIPGWFDEDEIEDEILYDEDLKVHLMAAKTRVASMTSQLRNLQDIVEGVSDPDDDENGAACGGFF